MSSTSTSSRTGQTGDKRLPRSQARKHNRSTPSHREKELLNQQTMTELQFDEAFPFCDHIAIQGDDCHSGIHGFSARSPSDDAHAKGLSEQRIHMVCAHVCCNGAFTAGVVGLFVVLRSVIGDVTAVDVVTLLCRKNGTSHTSNHGCP